MPNSSRHISRHIKRIAVAGVATLISGLLSACGGGGSSDSGSPPSQATATIQLTINGNGDATSTPAGYNCSQSQQACAFTVKLPFSASWSAAAGNAANFSNWQGCSSTQNTLCELTLGDDAQNKTIQLTLNFDQLTLTAEQAAAFLQRTTFGPTASEINALKDSSAEQWIDAQIAMQPTLLLPAYMERFNASGLSPSDSNYVGQSRRLRMDAWWDNSLHAPDQLRQRVAFALSEILVISDIGAILKFAQNGIADYYDTLARHAFGNYRELLEAVTLHPIMGDYLSMRRNSKANPANNSFPDENYAREIMQLFSIGLKQLNTDGSVKTDASGEPLLTYTQNDILSFARVYTGWNYGTATSFFSNKRDADTFTQPMKAFENYHDTDSKTLLNGITLPAGQNAQQDLDAALDNIFAHPNIAPYISTRLIERLVSSNPSPAYVGRVAAVFNDDGTGTKGNLAAVVKAILLDDEAMQPGQQQGKLKEPLLRISHLWRAFNASGINDELRYANSEKDTGQRALGSPSVFNFFQPDYAPGGAIKEAGLSAPEFQILNESTITATTNKLQAFTHAFHFGSGLAAEINQITLDLRQEQQLAAQPDELIAHLDLLLLAGRLRDDDAARLENYLNTLPLDDGLVRAREAVTLMVTSPEFALQW
jgi:uncharacterized protein (DUF1800 family)